MAYGIQIRNADGSLALDTDECFPQLVRARRVAGDWSGTIFISDFDITRGMFYIAPCFMKYRQDAGSFYRAADSAPLGQNPSNQNTYTIIGYSSFTMPTLSWDNGSKVMTITAANLPPNWPGSRLNYDYYIKFVHYKRRVVV